MLYTLCNIPNIKGINKVVLAAELIKYIQSVTRRLSISRIWKIKCAEIIKNFVRVSHNFLLIKNISIDRLAL